MSRGYYTISHITDYGPYVTKIILPLPAKVQAVAADAFTVYVQRLDPKGKPLLLPKIWMALDDK